MATIELHQVVKKYGEVQVVHGIDLAIADREFVVLVGPSGCGKSTLLRMIAGLEDISGGTISIGGKVVNEKAPKDRDIAMVFQDYALYPHLDVYRNMSFALEVRRMKATEIRQRVERAARILDLQDLFERKPAQLSGGQRQRVAMGRAMVREPRRLPVRRTALQSGCEIARRDAHRDQEAASGSAQDHRLRDARPSGGDDARRAHCGHAGRPRGADRDAERRLQQSGHPFRRGVHRCAAHEPAAMSLYVGPRRAARGCRWSHLARTTASDRRGSEGSKAGPLVLGIRPEAFSTVDDGPTAFDARIDFLEPLGSDTLIFFPVGNQEVVARLPPLAHLKEGQDIGLALDERKLHLFDAETERAIVATPSRAHA